MHGQHLIAARPAARPPAVHPQINNRHFCHKNPVKKQIDQSNSNIYRNANHIRIIKQINLGVKPIAIRRAQHAFPW